MNTFGRPSCTSKLRTEAKERVLMDLGNERSRLITAPSVLTEEQFRRMTDLKNPVLFRAYGSGYDCTTKWDSIEYLLALSNQEEEQLPHR